ncbi:hypothetical protein OPQ81_003805 [Rhizoctonia solani]|nr:hypothetical protein OPQ81_003805 [Rhizoctonia solani]
MADLENATSAHTPMSNMTPILEPAKITTEFPYITQLGHLFWIAQTTCPKIAFAVLLLAHFSSCYGPSHIAVLNHIHRYLKETMHIGITYDRNKPFYEVAYSDADFATQHGRKSITGSLIIMGGAAVAWSLKRQNTVSLSTMEAKFTAVCHTAKEVLVIRQFLNDLGIMYDSNVPTPILCDNQAAIKALHNPTHKTHAKHINISYNFIRDEIKEGRLSVSFILTCDNLTDAFMKLLNYNQHWYLANSFLSIHEHHHSNILGDFFLCVLFTLDQ